MKKNSICGDIRRSLSLLLVMTILCGIFTPVLATAADGSSGPYVYDLSRSIGISYVVDSYDRNGNPVSYSIGFSTKYFGISGFDTEDTDNLVINGDVFLLDEKGQEKKIFSYEYNKSYSATPLYSTDTNAVSLVPVFYDSAGNKLNFKDSSNIKPIGSEACYTGASPIQYTHPEELGIYGLHPDFKDYIKDKFGEENISISAETVYSWLLSESVNGKLYIRFTLEDGSGNTGTEILSGYRMSDCMANTSSYNGGIGSRLGYSRIEDMTDYHKGNTYNYLKMYKGNLYVDVDKIGSLGGSITLPNYNNTNLINMNSLCVGNNRVWYDGLKNITVTESYNIGNNSKYLFPDGAINTIDDAIYYFLLLCNRGETEYNEQKFLSFLESCGYDKDDYETGQLFSNAMSAYELIQSEAYTYQFLASNKRYVYTKTGTDIELASYIIGDLSDVDEKFWDSNSFIMISSLSLPEISLNISNSGVELKDRLNKYKEYLEEMKNFIYSYVFDMDTYDNLIDNNNPPLLYSGEFKNTDKSRTYTLDEVITILDEIIDLLNNTDDVADLSGLDGELEDLIGFRAAYADYSFENAFIPVANQLKPDNLMNIASELGIKTGFKGYFIKYEALDDPSEIMSCLSENATLFDVFAEQLIQDGTISRKHSAVLGERSERISESSVLVDSEKIKIPLSLFNQKLGEDNIISNYYYASGHKYVHVWRLWSRGILYQISGTMLYHGQKKSYGYMNHSISADESLSNGLSWHLIPFSSIDALYYNELTNIKFAKKPGKVLTDNEEYSTTDDVTVNWFEPENNGAEIIGYQIAVVPKGQAVTETDFLDSSKLEYQDLGDNYTVPYTTSSCSYSLFIGDTSKDVYIRAVNVIGVGDYKKITVNSELDLSITGPNKVYTGDSNVDYDTVDYWNNNVEPDVTYSLKDNPDKVSIDDEGRLTVDNDCELDSVTIISTGKNGTEYEGRSAYKQVSIIKPEPEKTTETDTDEYTETDTDKTPEPNATDTETDMTVNPPQTGDETKLMYFLVVEVLSGTLLMVGVMLYRKRKEY